MSGDGGGVDLGARRHGAPGPQALPIGVDFGQGAGQGRIVEVQPGFPEQLECHRTVLFQRGSAWPCPTIAGRAGCGKRRWTYPSRRAYLASATAG
jgi:hypothetical protein